MTAEEQSLKILKNLNEKVLYDNPEWENRNPSVEGLIEFAKYHTELALKSASEKFDAECNKQAILGSYSLENIK